VGPTAVQKGGLNQESKKTMMGRSRVTGKGLVEVKEGGGGKSVKYQALSYSSGRTQEHEKIKSVLHRGCERSRSKKRAWFKEGGEGGFGKGVNTPLLTKPKW